MEVSKGELHAEKIQLNKHEQTTTLSIITTVTLSRGVVVNLCGRCTGKSAVVKRLAPELRNEK